MKKTQQQKLFSFTPQFPQWGTQVPLPAKPHSQDTPKYPPA
jgi:hypothetical protein